MSAVLAFVFSPIGRWIVGAVGILALLGAIYFKGYADGAHHVQAKWDAAVKAAIEQGNAARTDAERRIDREPDGMRDRYQRD